MADTDTTTLERPDPPAPPPEPPAPAEPSPPSSPPSVVAPPPDPFHPTQAPTGKSDALVPWTQPATPAPSPPAPTPQPPQQTPAQRLASAGADLAYQQIADLADQRAALKAQQEELAKSHERESQIRAQALESEIKLHDSMIEDLRKRAELRANRPQTLPPTPPPQPHYTMPPGLFGHDNAPGNQWGNAMSAFSALAPGALNGNNIIAIKALTGALQGWHEGQKEAFEQNYKNWVDQSKYITDYNKWVTDRYNDVMEDNKLSFAEKKEELGLRATESQDMIAMETARRGDLKEISEIGSKRLELGDKIMNAVKTAEEMVRKSQPGGDPEDMTQQVSIFRQTGVMPRGIGVKNQAAFFAELKKQGEAEGKTPDEMAKEIQTAKIKNQAQQAGQTQRARTLNLAIATLDNIEVRLQSDIPNALAASNAVPRTKWVPINQLVNMWRAGTNDPAYTAFAEINNTIAEHYAKAMKPTGALDVRLQERALQILNTAKDQQAYATVLGQLSLTIENNAANTRRLLADGDLSPLMEAVPGAYYPPGQTRPSGAPAGGAAPAAGGTPARTPTEDNIKLMREHKDNPRARELFIKNFGADALTKYGIE